MGEVALRYMGGPSDVDPLSEAGLRDINGEKPALVDSCDDRRASPLLTFMPMPDAGSLFRGRACGCPAIAAVS